MFHTSNGSFRNSLNRLLLPGILAVFGAFLLWSGISVRSLWGPEGRWAMIVKEMCQSGDYFIPTVNGILDFDKPLLSHWLMLPFVWTGGFSEAMLRLPSTLAGLGTVLVVFAIGRRLYGSLAGFLAGAFLLASPFYIFWGRTASAEMMNAFSIWLMLWAFLVARTDGRPGYLLLFYAAGAVGSFFKGPVAPAVAVFAIFFSSCIDVVSDIREAGRSAGTLRASVRKRFFWLISRPAGLGVAVAIACFSALLFLPVYVTGSWVSVSLMWKENFVRFVAPFDHDDGPLSYALPILVFCGPWAFFMLASLVTAGWRRLGELDRWTLATVAGILLFFLLSGSRRSYYILPLIPGLALVTAKGVSDWINGAEGFRARIMGIASGSTIVLIAVLSAALFYVYARMPDFRHMSEIFMGAYTAGGVALAAVAFRKKLRGMLACTLLLVMFVVSVWGFTVGMRVAEQYRTLPEFAREARAEVDRVGEANVVLFEGASSIVLFYMDRKSGFAQVGTVKELEEFRKGHPAGLLIADLSEVPPDMKAYIADFTPIVKQRTHCQSEEPFAVLRFSDIQNGVQERP